MLAADDTRNGEPPKGDAARAFRGRQGVSSELVHEAEVAVAVAGDDVTAAECALRAALSTR